MEHRRRVLELLGGQVGDRLARDVGDAHAERQRVHEGAHHDIAALLRLLGVDVVDVQRVVVHGEQAEDVVVRLCDGLGRPVLVDGADLEVLQVAPVGMGTGDLPGGLIGLELMGRGIAHSVLWSLAETCVGQSGSGASHRRNDLNSR